MAKYKGLLKVIGLVIGMAVVAHTMNYFGLGNKVEVKEINGVPTNVLVK